MEICLVTCFVIAIWQNECNECKIFYTESMRLKVSAMRQTMYVLIFCQNYWSWANITSWANISLKYGGVVLEEEVGERRLTWNEIWIRLPPQSFQSSFHSCPCHRTFPRRSPYHLSCVGKKVDICTWQADHTSNGGCRRAILNFLVFVGGFIHYHNFTF